MDEYKLIFGYRHVSGVPRCPCGDPGNYLMMEQSASDPLSFRFTCWCGRTIKGKADTKEEFDKLVSLNAREK